MFEVTDKASDKIREILKEREEPVSAIRIIVSEGG
jgi:Fe-S cluster assembly iron-binding protein IscA